MVQFDSELIISSQSEHLEKLLQYIQSDYVNNIKKVLTLRSKDLYLKSKSEKLLPLEPSINVFNDELFLVKHPEFASATLQ